MDFSGAGISGRVVYHSVSLHACTWVLPRHGEIPWDGKLLELNNKSGIGVDSQGKAMLGDIKQGRAPF